MSEVRKERRNRPCEQQLLDMAPYSCAAPPPPHRHVAALRAVQKSSAPSFSHSSPICACTSRSTMGPAHAPSVSFSLSHRSHFCSSTSRPHSTPSTVQLQLSFVTQMMAGDRSKHTTAATYSAEQEYEYLEVTFKAVCLSSLNLSVSACMSAVRRNQGR